MKILFQFLIFALTAVFILLTVGFAQEVEGVNTSWPYLSVTFLYYMTSEKIICDDVIEHIPFVKYFKAAECREKLFGNLGLKLVALVLACVVNIGCLVRTGRWKLVALASYLNIYLKLRDIFKCELVKGSSQIKLKHC